MDNESTNTRGSAQPPTYEEAMNSCDTHGVYSQECVVYTPEYYGGDLPPAYSNLDVRRSISVSIPSLIEHAFVPPQDISSSSPISPIQDSDDVEDESARTPDNPLNEIVAETLHSIFVMLVICEIIFLIRCCLIGFHLSDEIKAYMSYKYACIFLILAPLDVASVKSADLITLVLLPLKIVAKAFACSNVINLFYMYSSLGGVAN